MDTPKHYLTVGPSQVDPNINQYWAEACQLQIMSIPHRSQEFSLIYKKVIELFREKLKVPEDYALFFLVLLQNAGLLFNQSLSGNSAVHFYNGSFGERWFNYAKDHYPSLTGIEFDIQEPIPISKAQSYPDLIALTQNETSNGTQGDPSEITAIRASFPKAIIAVDATSSLGGQYLDWLQADIWFASVQKCLSLPAGMAVMLCSPKAIHQALALNQNRSYNSITNLYHNFQKLQTTHTPNVLFIFLLYKILQNRADIALIDCNLKERARLLYNYFEQHKQFKPLINDTDLRSQTVVSLAGSVEDLQKYFKWLTQKNIILSNGYGKWKDSTLRIANFPASDITKLLQDYNE